MSSRTRVVSACGNSGFKVGGTARRRATRILVFDHLWFGLLALTDEPSLPIAKPIRQLETVATFNVVQMPVALRH
jgi:hypothetical protein